MFSMGEKRHEIFFRAVWLDKNICTHAFSEEFLPVCVVGDERCEEYVLSV